MKKYILRLSVLFYILIGIILFIPTRVNANEIEGINKFIKVDNNGNAKIVEIWKVDMDKGTEIYLPYDNLEDSEFKNLTVTDDRGINYETVSNWNPKASFEEKKDKCGINQTEKGIELHWGISEYGKREYRITYDLTNFVVQGSDYQFTYMCLQPKMSNLPIKNLTIKIEGIDKFSTDNIEFWSYGNNGVINIEDGLIVFDSKGRLYAEDYMTTLIKYKNKIFNTTSYDNRSFDQIKNIAMDGTKSINVKEVVSFALTFLVFLPLFIFIFKTITKSLTETKYIYKKPTGKIEKNIKKISYQREIPCDGDIKRICYILKLVGMLKDESVLLGAYILQWKKKGFIEIYKNEEKSNSVEIKFLTQSIKTDDDIEKKLWKIMLEAAKTTSMADFEKQILRFAQKYIHDKQEIDDVIEKDEKSKLILEANEFNKYCSVNYQEVLEIFYEFIESERNRLLKDSFIKTDYKRFKILFKKYSIYREFFTEKMNEEVKNIIGFKKFLLDYSLINEREGIEVELWDQYLIIAEILGIADKVEKQYENVYTKYKDLRYMSEREDIYITQKFYGRFYATAKKSKKNAESSGSSNRRDSGKGGSSYRRGGSGARGSSSSSGGTR